MILQQTCVKNSGKNIQQMNKLQDSIHENCMFCFASVFFFPHIVWETSVQKMQNENNKKTQEPQESEHDCKTYTHLPSRKNVRDFLHNPLEVGTTKLSCETSSSPHISPPHLITLPYHNATSSPDHHNIATSHRHRLTSSSRSSR